MQIIFRSMHIRYVYYDHEINARAGEREEKRVRLVYLSCVNMREDFISFEARSCNTNSDGNYDHSASKMTVPLPT